MITAVSRRDKKRPAGHVGEPFGVANAVLFLCFDKAGFITDENICIDGGMTKLMIFSMI